MRFVRRGSHGALCIIDCESVVAALERLLRGAGQASILNVGPESQLSLRLRALRRPGGGILVLGLLDATGLNRVGLSLDKGCKSQYEKGEIASVQASRSSDQTVPPTKDFIPCALILIVGGALAARHEKKGWGTWQE